MRITQEILVISAKIISNTLEGIFGGEGGQGKQTVFGGKGGPGGMSAGIYFYYSNETKLYLNNITNLSGGRGGKGGGVPSGISYKIR